MTVLINARERMNVGNWEASGSRGGFNWSVRKYAISGGRQDGVELIDIDNGRMKLTIVPTRGMGLWDACMGDLRLGWDAPCTEIVHPKYIDMESRGGLGWLEGFGEWVVRCGLENNGGPGLDTILNNNGVETQVMIPLHGKIANIPASFVSFETSRDEFPYLIIKGTVIEGFLFGTNLILETTIATRVGSTEVTVHDEVINNGEKPSEFELLYHCNYGPPILGEDARIVVPAARVTPRDGRAAETGTANYNIYSGPQPGTTEQCYFFTLNSDKDGQTAAVLRDAAGHKGVLQRWSVKELPCFTLWKNTQGLRDGYVTGLEPATNYPNHRGYERKHGRVPVLKPGASHHATVTYVALPDAAAVKSAEDEVAKIQGGRKTQVDKDPVEGICG